jgi:hypothetical protein
MSKFLTPLKIELLTDADGKNLLTRDGAQLWRVVSEFIYQSDVAQQNIVVPPDFVTDLASIPQAFLSLFGETAQRASVPHDFEYSKLGSLTREIADKMLKEACILSGVPIWKANLIYFGVRIGGGGHFRSE